MKTLTTLFLFGALVCAAEPAHHLKQSSDLSNVDAHAMVNVIVQWSHTPTDDQHQKVLSRGGFIRSKFQKVKAGAYSMPAAALDDLASDAEVTYISPDRPVSAKLDYTAAAVNASVAWNQQFIGTGIGVAVVDSGMVQSSDLADSKRIVYNQDFTGQIKADANVQNTRNAPDLFGHGQHVAGIIASNGKSSSCGNCTRLLKGMAPGVNLVNLRALDQNGMGSDSGVIAAIERAISLKDTYNIRVLNLSLGRPVYESYTLDPLCQAVEEAWKAGIVVVIAAGNEGRDNSMGTNGYGTISAPGNDPYAITVGAMKTMGSYDRSDDQIASYSSKGPTLIDGIVKPDIVAPGNQVVSLLASPNDTLAKQYPANDVPVSYYRSNHDQHASNVYFTLSGTSMATPVVGGAVADLLQAQPELTPDQVKARLMATAYKTFPYSSVATDPVTGASYVEYYDIFTVGAGYLDIAAALSSTAVANGTAMSPTAIYDSTTGNIMMVMDPSAVWDLRFLWGESSVFSAAAVWGAQSITGSRFLWGENGVDAARFLWGENTVDATRFLWGENVALEPSVRTVFESATTQPAPASAIGSAGTQSTSLMILGEQ